MTEQEVKDFLSEARGIKRTIRNLQDVINKNKLLSTCYGSLQTDEKVQTSPRLEARYTELVEEQTDAERELKRQVKRYQDKLVEIIRVIHTLENNEEIEVLMYRYVEELNFYRVRKKAHMSETKMYRVHKEALKKIAKNWEFLGVNL